MLRLAYLANIVILVPVVTSMLSGPDGTRAVFEGRVQNSDELRILVGCLWGAILVCSLVGLIAPSQMIGILVLQVVYKAGFLWLVARPAYTSGGWAAVPPGLTVTFIVVVVVWPLLLAGHIWFGRAAGASA